jgi:hypothetical protein
MANPTVAQGWYWDCPACGEHATGFVSDVYAQLDADRHTGECEGLS